jgi:hypothetical protein
MYIRVLTTALILSLIGCSDSTDIQRNTTKEESPISGDNNKIQEGNNEQAINEPSKSVTDKTTPQTEKTALNDRSEELDEKYPTIKKRTIDLTLPEDWDKNQPMIDDLPQDALLPDLFSEKKETKDISLGGKLINDESNDDYVDSIEGAEVSVEIKLN